LDIGLGRVGLRNLDPYTFLVCRLSVRLSVRDVQVDYVFLPRDASAERGNTTVSRQSVCPSVCLSVTIGYRVQIRWNCSKVISRPNSLRSMHSLTPNMGDLVQREHPQNWVEYMVVSLNLTTEAIMCIYLFACDVGRFPGLLCSLSGRLQAMHTSHEVSRGIPNL